MPYPMVHMILYFFIYSFCGWLLETALCSVSEKHFVNRGFLNGPVCPIYGCAVLLMLIFLIPVRNSVSNIAIALPVVFFAGVIVASVVEYVTSWAMEKLFHARWWDYSHKKWNLSGRICLEISITWGVLATVFIYWVQPVFDRLTEWLYAWNALIPPVISTGMGILFIIDFSVSVHVAKIIGEKLVLLDKWSELLHEHLESLELPTKEELLHKVESAYERFAAYRARFLNKQSEKEETVSEWQALPFETLRHKVSDYAEELREKRNMLISGIRPLQRRMLKAFPHMKWQGSALQDVRRNFFDPHEAENEDATKDSAE